MKSTGNDDSAQQAGLVAEESMERRKSMATALNVPPEWREYAGGWGAAVVNITVTFPIHKTMFRQMVHGFSMFDALRQLRMEGGMKNLYRGILPPLLSKSTSTCLMFGTYSQYSRQLTDLYPSVDKAYILSSAALLAGCTEAVLAPFERVQVILQDSKHNYAYRNTAHALKTLYMQHGVSEYYRGLSAILLRNGPSNVIFFASKEKIRESLPLEWTEDEGRSKTKKYVADFLCGSVTGAIISTIFYPVNATRTHMQLVVGGKFLSFFSVFRELLETRGLRGMFKGVHLNYSRSFLSWGIINVTYEFIHKKLMFISDLPS